MDVRRAQHVFSPFLRGCWRGQILSQLRAVKPHRSWSLGILVLLREGDLGRRTSVRLVGLLVVGVWCEFVRPWTGCRGRLLQLLQSQLLKMLVGCR